MGKTIGYDVRWNSQTPLNTSPLDSDLFYDDPGSTMEFSNAFGDGLKKVIKGSQSNTALKQKAKIEEAKANKIAAKSLGKKDDSAAVLAASLSKTGTIEKKSNTMLYVGVGVTVLLLAIGGYYLTKKKKG